MRPAAARAFLSLSSALLLCAPGTRQAIAEPAAGGPALSLSKNDRLRKPLALHERFITVAEALVKISRATGVRLRARSPQIGNENVILLVRQRPAGEVLDLLASALEYRWSPIDREQPNAGYELSQDADGRQREAEAADRYRRAGIAELEKEIALQEMFDRMPDKQAGSRWNEIIGLLKMEGLSESEREALQREQTRLFDAMQGPARTLLALYAGLSRAQRDRLIRGEPLRFSSIGAPGMDPLPEAIARSLRELGTDDVVKWYHERYPLADVRAELHIHWLRRRVSLIARSQVIAPDPPGYGPPMCRQVLLSRSVAGAPGGTPRAVSDPRLRRDVSLMFAPKHVAADDPSTYVRQLMISDVIGALAEQQPELDFIGDAYLDPVEFPRASRGSVGELLDVLASAADVRWRLDPHGCILTRSATVFLDRPRSIPATLLRGLMTDALRNGGLTLRAYASLATQLTDAQIDGIVEERTHLNEVFLWPRIDTVNLALYRGGLRFLAALTGQQLEAILGGRPLTYAGLSPRQREAFGSALEILEVNEMGGAGSLRGGTVNGWIGGPPGNLLPRAALQVTLDHTPPQVASGSTILWLRYLMGDSAIPPLEQVFALFESDPTERPK